MVKVRVLHGLTVGLPVASFLATGVTACANPAAEDVSADDSALTIVDPGTGTLTLGWSYGSPSGYGFTAKNSTDEYVRPLEKMSFVLPAQFLWASLHPGESIPQDIERLKKLSASLTVTYVNASGAYGATTLSTQEWEGQQAYGLRATTPMFTVDKRAQSMRFAVEMIDNGASPPVKKTFGAEKFAEQPVIGGSLPNKTLLLDHLDRTLRQRILEGGLPVSDADLALAYTDWRAASLVDSSSIDRQIGTAQSHGRFGSFEMPIYGDVSYDISYAVAIDGVWQAEQKLNANSKSRLLPNGRTAYEGVMHVPGGARNIAIYFHVKAFLEVDYSKHSDVRWRKYQDGARVLMKDRFDNENNASGDNYDFGVESR